MRRPRRFLVEVRNQWLVFAPLHDLVAVVNSAAARALATGVADQPSDLADLDAATRQPLAPDVMPTGHDGRFPVLGLIPTRRCNLACAYCDFGATAATGNTMDPALAVAAVDWMATRLPASGRRGFRLHFFGGEPFLTPDLVEIAVHRARLVAGRHQLTLEVDASTNGVFDERTCQFVADYFTGIAISLDGPPELHDRLRSRADGGPSFAAVSRTVKRLMRSPVDLCLRMCVTDEGVAELEKTVRWMIETFRPSTINVEPLITGCATARAGLRAPDPFQFAAHCIAAYRIGEERGVRIVYSAAEMQVPRLSLCPADGNSFIVTPDGRLSACYLLPEEWRRKGLPFDLGRVGRDGSATVDARAVKDIRELSRQKARCSRCFCQWTCAGGCHVSQTCPGSSSSYTDFCLQTRIISACVLLHQCGCDGLVDGFLSDRAAMERLASCESDVPASGDWEVQCG